MSIYTNSIEKLYVAYFSRPAEPAGLQFWEQVLASQNGSVATANAINDAFFHSSEYADQYTELTAVQRVDQIYVNLFGRHAEAGGLLFWADNLRNGNLTVSNLVTTIANAAQGNDLVAINSKVAAATWFTNSLDTPSEIAAYSGAQAIMLERIKLQTVVDEQSLANYRAGQFPDVIHYNDPITNNPPVIGPMTHVVELTGQAPSGLLA